MVIRNGRLVLVAGLTALAAVACSSRDDNECESNIDCASGQVCTANVCVTPTPTDAGTDAGTDSGTDSGTDAGTDAGPTNTDIPADPTTPENTQIQAFLAATANANGTATAVNPPLPISGVYVTYISPAVGSTPAGFYVQATAPGPSFLVKLDAAAQTPALAVGDKISFNVTEKTLFNGLNQASAISGLTRESQGAPVQNLVDAGTPGLAVDISNRTDVKSPAALAAYESDLVQVRGTVASPPALSGSSFTTFTFVTAGSPAPSASFILRMPNAVVTASGLGQQCNFTAVAVPYGRFGTVAQISPFRATDLIVACPVTVTGARSVSPTTAEVLFNVNVDATTIQATDFTITPELAISAVEVTDNKVKLTTAAQTEGTRYTVTAAGLSGTNGAPVSTTAATAGFWGSSDTVPAGLIINELEYDNVGTTDDKEFIELINNSDAPVHVGNMVVVLVNASPNGTTPATSRAEYRRIELSSVTDGTNATDTLAPGALLVVGPATVTNSLPAGTLRVTVANPLTDLIQNGADDSVGLLYYPTGVLTDALWYETDDRAPVTVFTATIATGVGNRDLSFVEGTQSALFENNQNDVSYQRKVDPEAAGKVLDANNNSTDFEVSLPTPGAKR